MPWRASASKSLAEKRILVEVDEGNLTSWWSGATSSRDPAAIKDAVEGLISDVVLELETERFARQPRKCVTGRRRDA